MGNENKYLGEEKIYKLLLKFSVPCVMALLISALYNIVDQIFIGNSSLGYLGNAATGVSFPIICIANAFAWCVGDGAASYLSICSGRKDTESAHKCVGTGIVLTIIISIALLTVCEVFAKIEEQVVLVGEILIKTAAGNTGGADDLIDGRIGAAHVGELLPRGLHQPLALGLRQSEKGIRWQDNTSFWSGDRLSCDSMSLYRKWKRASRKRRFS